MPVVLGYFLLLVISAILYANHDSRIWSRAVRHFVWPDHGFSSATAPAPRSIDSEPTSMSGLNGGRLGFGFGVGKHNDASNVGTGGPTTTTKTKRRSIISIIAPKPRRTTQSNVLGHEREHGPEHIIEPFHSSHPSGGGPSNDINAYDTIAYGHTYGNTYGNYVNNNSDNQMGQTSTAWNVAITRPARAAAAGPSSSQMAERTQRRVSRTYPDTSFYSTHVQTALAAQPYDGAPPLRVQNPSHSTPSSTPPPVSLPPPPPPPPPVSLKYQKSQRPQNDARRTDTTSSRKTGEKRLVVSPAQAESELEWQQSRSRPRQRQRAVVSPLPSQPVVPTFPPPVAVTSPRSRPSGPRSRSKSQNGDWTRPPPLDLSGVSSFGERRRG